MKTYGRNKSIKGLIWKRDYHIREKGYVNWWETLNTIESRSTIKQSIKKDIDLT